MERGSAAWGSSFFGLPDDGRIGAGLVLYG